MRHGRSIVRVFCVPAPTVRQILPHDYIALTDSRAQTMISRAFSAILGVEQIKCSLSWPCTHHELATITLHPGLRRP